MLAAISTAEAHRSSSQGANAALDRPLATWAAARLLASLVQGAWAAWVATCTLKG